MRAKAAKKSIEFFQNAGTSLSHLMKYLVTGCILASVLMTSSGVSLENSLLLSLAIIAQWIPGALLWTWVKRESSVAPTELIGMGLAIGTFLALLSSQLFRTSPIGIRGWAIPFLISMPFVVWSRFRRKGQNSFQVLNPNFRHVVRSFSPALVLGVIQLSIWWRWHPLKWSGWWKYNVDVPYFETFSNSIAILGTTHNLMDPALDSRYHWFAYAWVGSITNTLHIESFVVLTRLLPIVSMVMGATIAYSWAKSMSGKFWIPGLAALIIVAGPGLSVGSFVILRSPSSAMSVGWSLAFSLLLFEIIKGEARRPIAYLVLGLLAAAIVGGKASNTVLVGLTIFALLIMSFGQNRENRKRILISGSISLIILGVTFQLLIASSLTRPLNVGIFFGWPGLFLTIFPTIIGIYGLYQNKQSIFDPLLVYVVSLIFVGSLLSLITHDSAGSQLYFLVHAAIICIVPSLIGLERFLYRENEVNLINLLQNYGRQSKLYLGILVIVGGVLTSIFWILFENSTSSIGKMGRTLAPAPLWVLCFLGSFVLGKKFSPQVRNSKKRIDLLLVTLISATLVCSGSGILYSIFNGPLYSRSSGILSYGKSTESDSGSISYNYVLAGKWVQEHITSNEMFFTNRQCIEIKSTSANCDGLWAYASALSRRQFVIEGGAYSNQSKLLALTRLENQNLSIRFSLNPNDQDLQSLWAKHVRWGWIDRKVSSRTDWGKYAQEIFSNSDVAIIKLVEPKI